jgi:hypothetical protein
VLAYEAAEKGDHSVLEELAELFRHPYNEQSAEMAAKYYRRTPPEFRNKGGVAFFS